MDRIDPSAQCQCWVDIFEAGCFMGRMRRLVGPRKLRDLRGKSVIVGPRATVLLNVRREGRDTIVKLPPKRAVPDLSAAVGGAKIRSVTVTYRI
ncbi:MAG TPA: hypothetical protein VHX86_06445 [Tepidisphaeraceae bacterium]|jgi:hypothetical protein|nr:hypothetical protein [Tepidisphaeraceae bacterium]